MDTQLPTIPLVQFSGGIASRLRDEAHHFIITGAGGWFGLATLEMLDEALGSGIDHRVWAFANLEREVVLRSGRRIRVRPLSSLASLARPSSPLCLLHYAFLTREKVSSAGSATYVVTNRHITSFIESQCRRLLPEGSFSTSSGAVYRRDGEVDNDIVSNPYGALKLEEEEAFSRLRRDIGLSTAICRVFNVGGPFLNKEYALGSLIRSALFGQQIDVQAGHQVFRSYAHITDIVSIGVAIAARFVPSPERPYDTAGSEIVEVGQLAERVRDLLNCSYKPIVRTAHLRRSDDFYFGKVDAFKALAEAAGISLKSLSEQIRDTARFLAE